MCRGEATTEVAKSANDDRPLGHETARPQRSSGPMEDTDMRKESVPVEKTVLENPRVPENISRGGFLGEATCVDEIVPTVVWVDHILPFLDRDGWNSLILASKRIYMLTKLSKLSADYRQSLEASMKEKAPKSVIQPRWPTKQPFLSKRMGGQGQAIVSFCLSNDGEYLACASVLGIVELWSLRSGKLTWRNDTGEGHSSSSQQRYNPSAGSGSFCPPFGSLLKFSPVGTILACAFENKIVLWDFSREINENQKKGRKTWELLENLNQTTIEVKRRHASIYEVTYLGFSNDGSRLIARYGKMAFVWNIESIIGGGDRISSAAFMTHKIPLYSSRSLVTTDSSLRFLAISSNGSSGKAGTTYRMSTTNSDHGLHGVARGGNESNRNPLYPATDSISAWKGVLHIWDLGAQKSLGKESKIGVTKLENWKNRIFAHRDHAVRGLEFMRYGRHEKDIFLLSASLQGEVKFWKETEEANDSLLYDRKYSTGYVCLHCFQSPGKIFSLTSWSSISSEVGLGDGREPKMYIAAGEARGRIRLWNVSTKGCLNSDLPPKTKFFQGRKVRNFEMEVESDRASFDFDNEANDFFRTEELFTDEVGDHVYYDNIKMLCFTPDSRALAVSRAYDAKIWFQTVWQ